MNIWIPITIAAALFQTVRFMLQKVVSTSRLSAAGATWSRFVYSAPMIIPLTAAYLWATQQGLPDLNLKFWLFAAIGGSAQIFATLCVVMLFKSRNFAVGITFKKTEVIQTAILGFLVLGDVVSPMAGIAIGLGLVAVLLLSKTPGDTGAWWRHLTNRASMLGLGSGILFAFSAVFYRGASLELLADDPVLRAAVTLSVVVTMQMTAMAAWLFWCDRPQIGAVWAARRQAGFIGLTSMGGSFCWFLAFTLQNASYVKALGQVELLLSVLASVLFFRETITRQELAGMAFLIGSILLLVLAL
jgi:drug/metabolite transporter (DMT)-like permease